MAQRAFKMTIRRKVTIFIAAFGMVLIILAMAFQAVQGTRFLFRAILTDRFSIATVMADEIASTLKRNTGYLAELVDTVAIRDALTEVNDRYAGMDQAVILLMMQEKDAAWVAPETKQAVAKEYLETPQGRRLTHLVRDLPYIKELFITDRYGGLLAASGRTTDFYQADEVWWQRVSSGISSECMVEGIAHDESSDTLGLIMTFSMRDDAEELLGICKAVINTEQFWKGMEHHRLGKTGCVALIDQDGLTIFHHDQKPLAGRLLGTAQTAMLLGRGWVTADDVSHHEGKMLLVAKEVRSPLLAERDIVWYVVISQSLDEAFAPLHGFLLESGAVLLLLVLCMVFAVSYMAKRMVAPLARLNEGVSRLAAGEYHNRIDLQTGDELGDLAGLINDMAGKIEQSRDELQKHTLEMERQQRRVDTVNAELVASNRKLSATQEELAARIDERSLFLDETQAAVINMMEDLQGSKEELERSVSETKKAYEELKELQRRLIQSEKMSALGRFSAGIAHEVKNPLAIMLGGMEYLQTKLATADEDTKTVLGKIKDAVLRADGVLQNLLKFSRPANLETEVVTPEAVIDEVLALFKYKFPLTNIRIETVVTEKGMHVSVDKNQVEQVLFNLFLNAADAMPKGGPITVTISRAVERQADERPRSFCVIEVKDAGEGITPDNLVKIFEPFFTTKRDRGGTGLGLAVARSIIEHHEGTLELESEPGKGTLARITLPFAART